MAERGQPDLIWISGKQGYNLECRSVPLLALSLLFLDSYRELNNLTWVLSHLTMIMISIIKKVLPFDSL